MKIFISWSKPNSNSVALALQKFIENIFDDTDNVNIQFFISSEDIYAGDSWFEVITEQLKSSNLAIICLTKENKYSKWLDFESGAVAFNNQDATVCPFLFNLDSLENGNPLNALQLTKNDEKSLLKLVKTIARKAGSTLTEKQLGIMVKGCYPDLKHEFDAIIQATSSAIDSDYFDNNIYPNTIKGTVPSKLFLGTPMASIDSDQYLKNREEILEIIEAIETHCEISVVYSPVVMNSLPDEFDGQEKAMEIDFAELKQSEYYVFIYPEKVASSILVEIGYSIALMKKTIIFVKQRENLPFMLEHADKRNKNIKIIEYKDLSQIKKKLKNEGKFLFNFN